MIAPLLANGYRHLLDRIWQRHRLRTHLRKRHQVKGQGTALKRFRRADL